MNNVYEYLLTIFNVLVGLVTTERLIYSALIALGIYIVWIFVSLVTSFQRKFNTNCTKLYNFLKKNQINATNLKIIDLKIDKISSGFAFGWKKFKNSSGQKPSEFINRREALDVEVSGGVLNQGKTLMRAFINITTVLLFIVNLAYRGAESKVTAYLIAETMVLPFIYYAVIKIFYFLYTSIKQQFYKMDIESFYEVIDLLDTTFAGVSNNDFESKIASEPVQEVVLEKVEVATGEEMEPQEEPVQAEEEEEDEEVKLSKEEEASQKYDFFKKKNIDVDKLVSEVPSKATKTSLPYINVDSDFVITDETEEETAAVPKTVLTDVDNGSELLGGMMQDMSSIKKANEQSEEPKAEQAQTAEPAQAENAETASEPQAESTTSEESNVETTQTPANPLDSLSAFEVAENKPEPAESSKEEQKAEEVQTTESTQTENAETVSEPQAEAPAQEDVTVIEPPVEDKKSDIASIVGGFKANKSKLANGGVVIERNTPIAKREQPSTYGGLNNFDSFNDNTYQTNPGVTKLDVSDSTSSVLGTMKGGSNFDNYGYNNQSYDAGYQNNSYNQNYQDFGANQTYVPPMNTGYSVPTYQGPIAGQFGGYGSSQFGQNGFNQVNQNPYPVQAPIDSTFGDTDYEEFDDEEVEEVEEVKAKPQKKIAKKAEKLDAKDEPRPRNLKKKTEKTKEVEPMEEQKKRGRPKKQVFDETVSIKNDKEFDEVLARAEKLMRKSDEGLSQSQSKRIEKELKTLMDAMNKYKEGK